jgi:hypothetical protein
MRWVAALLACAGCDALFRVDSVATPLDAQGSAQSSGTFCSRLQPSGMLLTCADFDEPNDPLGAFFINNQTTSATIAATQTVAFSMPSSLETTTPQDAGALALVDYLFPVTTFYGTVDLDLYVEQNCGQTLAELDLPGANGSKVVSILVDNSGTLHVTLVGGGSCMLDDTFTRSGLGQWSHVTIEIRPDDIAAVTIAGEAITLSGNACSVATVSAPTLILGVHLGSGTATCANAFDNVVVVAN